jgi:concanavalin A-like lectin/glucanase superfamily protein/type IX secretion system substrate protein
MRLYKYIFVFLLFISALIATETPNCLCFEDEDDYVYINDAPLRFTSRFTIECWFNVHEFTDSSALIDFSTTVLSDDKYFGYGIYTMDSNRIAIHMGDFTNKLELILSDINEGIWQHLAITFDKYKNDENLVVFLNGRVVKKEDCNIRLQYPETFRPYGVFLGAFYDYPHLKAFKGELDEVRFWNIVRTNSEILNSMDIELSSEETGLVGYYTFNQENDTLLNDLSPNENHGKLGNMTDSSWQLSYAQLAVQQANDISFDRMVLSWIGASDFDSYLVDLSLTEDFAISCDGFPVDDVETNYYILDDIDPGSYYYRVKGHYDGKAPENEPWTDIQYIATVTDVASNIELADFQLIPLKDRIHITWQTASQTENAKFILERKTENTDWLSIYETQGDGTNNILMDYSYDDENIRPGNTYYYRVMDLDYSGKLDSSHALNARISDEILSRNVHFNLNKIYPNPFNPQVTISFNVITESDINLSIYSSNGDLVDIISDKKYQSGSHILYWNPKGLSTGIYFLKINSKNQSDTHKLLYMK